MMKFLLALLKPIHRFFEAIRVRLQPGENSRINRWLTADIQESEQDFVRDADRFMLQQEPLRARILVRALLVVFILFIVWAALVKVDEVTRGDGKVIPSRQLQILQSLDGGIVSEILVAEGEAVDAGQILFQIDATRSESLFRENRAQYLALSAKAARLYALGENKPFDPPADVEQEAPRTVEDERRLYEEANNEIQAQIAIAQQQLVQRQQELSEARVRRAQAAEALESVSREYEVTKPLLASGAVSEMDLVRLERDIVRFRGERDVAATQISRAQSAITEATRKIQEVELNTRNTARREYSETMATLNALIESSSGLADRVTQSAIRSPVKGTVSRLLVNTVGGVVQPGRDVVEIVPSEDQLLLEAKVLPKDIAFLRPGQRAMVKFTAYDFSIYGGLEATLDHIGADSVTDERGNTFYIVRVRTDKPFLSEDMPIIPGMVAEVDIITGEKSILNYLLKPVLRAKQAALSER